MNFELTEERQMLQDSLRRFLANRSDDVWSGLAELGVIGALFGEEDGGFGGAGFDLAVVFEELGRADHIVELIDQALVPGLLLSLAGRNLDDVISGETRLALAHMEVDARYDLNWVETMAKSDKLTGEKCVVIGAEQADYLLVSARHSGDVDDQNGIGLWLVKPDAPGLVMRSYDIVQGGRATEISMSETPAEPLMPEAYEAISQAIAAATLAQMAQTLGAMESALEMTRDYLVTRKQFGRAIGTFQALGHRLVDLMVELEQSRSAVILAANALQDEPDRRDRHISAAKNILGRAGRQVAEDVIQLHGGIGMTEEYALGRYAKKIAMADHRFGDIDHHMERFIALST